MRALIVNERAATRNQLRRTLARAGFQVAAASSPRKAVEVLDGAGPVDLALVGWTLRREQSLSFVREVRSRRECDGMRLVMVTGGFPPEELLAALRAGVDECLVTPVTLERLRALLERLGLRPDRSPGIRRGIGEWDRSVLRKGPGPGGAPWGGAHGARVRERFRSMVRGGGP